MLVFKFVLFMSYATTIFLLPNLWWCLLLIALINLSVYLVVKPSFPKIWWKLYKFLPFIGLTFVFNLLFDNLSNALFASTKLLLVCIITLIYATTISSTNLSHILIALLRPFEKLGFNLEELSLLICLAITIAPTTIRDATEIGQALKAKNAQPGIRIVQIVVFHFVSNIVLNINHTDEALRAKGIF